MIALSDALRVTARRLFGDIDHMKLPSYSSSKAYEREWLRRQREAVRKAIENNRQIADQ